MKKTIMSLIIVVLFAVGLGKLLDSYGCYHDKVNQTDDGDAPGGNGVCS